MSAEEEKKQEEDQDDSIPFFPDHALTEIYVAVGVLFLFLLIGIWGMSHPVGLEEQADALNTPEHSKPEWYFFPTYRFLKLVPLITGIALSTAFVIAMIFWPFIEPLISKQMKTRNRFSYIVGVLTVFFTVSLTVWEMFFA